MTDTTISYYNRHADEFFDQTVNVDMSPLYDRFLAHVPSGGHILDAGCGSGRDAKVFLDRAFKVTAFDASTSLAKKASEFLGQRVDCRRFDEIEYAADFDGVWACASLLHVNRNELHTTVARLCSLLKQGGIFYASFKQGHEERKDANGRHFTDMTLEGIHQLIDDTNTLVLLDAWQTIDQRPDRKDESWWNMLGIKR